MKIMVGIKQILDPEVPVSDFRVDSATRKPVQGKAKLVMDSYSEYALEAALQYKDKNPGTQVVAACVGDKPAEEVLRKALAAGADEAIRAWEPGWDDLEAQTVAHILGSMARRLGGIDLVMVGRQSGDVERGLVGPMLAEDLGAACVTQANRVEAAAADQVRVRTEIEGGFAEAEIRLPAVVTVSNDEGIVLRLPKVRDVMMASRKPIGSVGASDLSLVPARLVSLVSLKDLFIPQLSGQCEFVEGENGGDKAVRLTQRLREAKVV